MRARLKDYLWPLIGLVAVIWSVRLLYFKLEAEAATNPLIKAALEKGDIVSNIATIARVIGGKVAAIPPEGVALATLSAILAYLALGWYDKLALMHLKKDKAIPFPYVATTAFVTYAIAHNIGASVLSGGAVRYRAYTAKGLTGAEVAILVAICTLTFFYATALMLGFALIGAPHLLQPMAQLSSWFAVSETTARVVGLALLAACMFYMIGALLDLPAINIKGTEVAYPEARIVAIQTVIAPLEIIGAAGIIYFALPTEHHPGFLLILGAFLLSFCAGLVSQVPGGVGVMEAIFLALMPDVPASSVLAALLVWRLLYLILPLVIAIPVVLLFERARYAADHPKPM
jgi:uncharacterized membrane protein YbhN (UPF0104 family)